MANHLFTIIFESVDEHHFLKIWGHSDLRLQKYAEVAENSLRLIKNVSITKSWFSTLLQVARLIFYPETSNRHQNFSLACRQPQPRKIASEYFFKKMPFLWCEINLKSSISWKFEEPLQRYLLTGQAFLLLIFLNWAAATLGLFNFEI